MMIMSNFQPDGLSINVDGREKLLVRQEHIKNQALVLVNHGDATGVEILDFSTQILRSVKDRYNIELEREVMCGSNFNVRYKIIY